MSSELEDHDGCPICHSEIPMDSIPRAELEDWWELHDMLDDLEIVWPV